MWRHASASYLKYSSEMASILRSCLKEPFRTKAMNRSGVYFKEGLYQSGAVIERQIVSDAKNAFNVTALPK